MKNSEILINAKKLIEKPENWTKKYLAKDSFGYKVEPLSEKAVCFCSVGAVKRASGFHDRNADSVYNHECVLLLNEALLQLEFYQHGVIWLFNDRFDTEHEKVIKVFDKAIEIAKEQEQ